MAQLRIFDRQHMLGQMTGRERWDIIVIGGGATGLGTALDAASRGYATLLVEQYDFAKGTSSRSTKLVHGGVRYLAQGNIKLVYGALHERGILLRNAPHVVRPQSFIIPCYTVWDKIKYSAGLKLYDLLAGSNGLGRSAFLSPGLVHAGLPNMNMKKLKGGVQYADGQFDDARLAINIARTAAEHGAVLLNYCRVTNLLKKDGKINGVQVSDTETNASSLLYAKTVINATGVFVDDILQMDQAEKKPMVSPSQGVHLVVDKHFLPGGHALLVPETSDGRVLFAVPWHDHVLIGTTDTPLDKHMPEPIALDSEIEFILGSIAQYLTTPPERKDVLTVFAGLRPLAAPSANKTATKEISRDHKLITSDSGLITITGGKWTTYRKMAEDTVNAAIRSSGLPQRECLTKNIRIHGAPADTSSASSVYGTDQEKINLLIKENPALASRLVDNHPYTAAEVVWAVRNEMARTVEDVLARRIRLLFLDAQAAREAAPAVAELMMKELHLAEDWKRQQLSAFMQLSAQYLLHPQ